MTDNVVQFRDFQNKRDFERMYAEAGNDCPIASSVALIPHDREIAGVSPVYLKGLTNEEIATICSLGGPDTSPSEMP